MAAATEQEDALRRIPLRPLQSIPPFANVARLDPRGQTIVEVSNLCDKAGIRYGLTGGFPPLIVLRQGDGDVRAA